MNPCSLNDLSFEEYQRYAPRDCLDGSPVHAWVVPPKEDLRALRRTSRDPRLAVFKRAMGGWVLGRLGSIRYADGSRLVVWSELPGGGVVPSLGPPAIEEVARRSSAVIGEKAVDGFVGKRLAEFKQEQASATAAARAESDARDYETRIKPALEARGSHNIPYEDRAAPFKAAEKAIEKANGDLDKIPLAALGVKVHSPKRGRRATAQAAG